MSLVAYGSSDESDSEESNTSDSNTKNSEIPEKDSFGDEYSDHKNEVNTINPKEHVDRANYLNHNESGVMFSHLPSPRSTFSIPDNTLKLLNKKQPVKIVLPSLSEIKDDEEVKKRKPSTQGSGLFALLPAPKNTTSLVPNVVKNNALSAKSIPKKTIHPNTLKKPVVNSTPNVKHKFDYEDENDENMDKPESFFFNSVDDVKPDEMDPVVIPDITEKSKTEIPQISQEVNQNQSFGTPVTSTSSDNAFVDSPHIMDANDLNEEAIEKLIGAGAKKRKGGPEEIIDINVDSMVGDAYMWLSKDLTKEQEHASFKKPKNLSVVERRKHQITYLASQAKEKEMELRNQWANSRITRKQTQSKYGF